MVIDSKLAGQGGAILRYQSSDLIHWTYQGLLLQGDQAQSHPFQSGAVWECPNFVQLGDQHPSRADSDGVEVFGTAGRVRLVSLDAWSLEA